MSQVTALCHCVANLRRSRGVNVLDLDKVEVNRWHLQYRRRASLQPAGR